MRFKTGKYVTSEEEKEYIQKKESINAEELASMFESKVKIELSQYMDKFDKIKEIEGEGFFSPLNTNINREQLEDLTIKFFYSVSAELGSRVEDILKKKNSNIKLNLNENSEKFYSECLKYSIDGGIKFQEGELEQIKDRNPELYKRINELNKEIIIKAINLSLTGYLGDLYNLVHEITHYFTLGDTSTLRILGEVAPQCMERLLDDFLLELSEKELEKYNFNIGDLKKDVKRRRIISFVSRYKATEKFNKSNSDRKSVSKMEEEELLKYFLAQLFQSQFRKNSKNTKKEKILEFMDNVNEDEFERAIKSFGISLSNKLKRSFYIEDMINDIKIDLDEKKPKIETDEYNSISLEKNGKEI